ncbi:MAG: DsbA family protein [Gemmatimonadetes bacterium]|nr:DsbA family protein [Gemmatimonadota bacterium]
MTRPVKRETLISNLTSTVLVICALLITGLVVRRELGLGLELPGSAHRHEIVDAAGYRTGLRRAGPDHASVTVVEFSDFQCPFCRVMAARLDSLREAYPEDIAVEYRHYPLSNHQHAIAAARASDCARVQGRFWPMHDALFQNQDSIGVVPWTWFAAKAGVRDLPAFSRCTVETAVAVSLREDIAAGHRLGVEGTPTLLVGPFRLNGTVPLDSLRAYVDRVRTHRN